jgi:hypothetical protein
MYRTGQVLDAIDEAGVSDDTGCPSRRHPRTSL